MLIQIPHSPEDFPYANLIRRIVDLASKAGEPLIIYTHRYYYLQGRLNQLKEGIVPDELEPEEIRQEIADLEQQIASVLRRLSQAQLLLEHYHDILTR